MKKVSILFLFVFGLSLSVQAQMTPERGSELRSKLINTLRATVQKELKQDVIFRVNRISVSDDWAFIAGEPIKPNGNQPDYSKTVYKDDVQDGFFDNNVFALLKKRGSNWRVVKHLIGCTDVCYLDWYRLYKAPVEIFGIPKPEVSEVTKKTVIKPKRGSKLRKNLINTLRVPVQKELKQKIIFRVSDIRVLGEWAYIGGEPLTPKGGTPSYKNTIYAEDVEDGIFDNNVFGLLQKKGDKWVVVSHLIGCTDACFLGWLDQYKIPKAILPID